MNVEALCISVNVITGQHQTDALFNNSDQLSQNRK